MLQFNESAYGNAFQQGQNNEQADRDRNLEMLQSLSQGFQNYQSGQMARQGSERANQLYELQLSEAQRKAREEALLDTTLGDQFKSKNSLSQPVAPTSMLDQLQMPGMGEGGMPQMGGGMMEKFRQYQMGGLQGNKLRPPQVDMSSQALAQPDLSAFGLPQEAMNMTPRQLQSMGQAKKLFAEANPEKQPGSIDAILAQRVNNGEMTIEEAMELKRQNNPGSFMMGGMTGEGQPVFYNTKNPNNTVTAPVPGGGVLYPKTPSEGQMNAGLFGKRAMEADQQLQQMMGAGLDPTSVITGGQEYLPNIMKGSGMQQFDQAKRNFINAVLRKESGAMISNQEMENANKQYFPQIGDQPDVLKQKSVNRQTAIQGLGTMAGPMGNQMKQTGAVGKQVGRFVIEEE